MKIQTNPRVAARLLLVAGLVTGAYAQVPTYSVTPIATYSDLTRITGVSEVGHVVGWQNFNGTQRPFLATESNGMQYLPLPPGYQSGAAMDVNESGMVVGTASQGTFPFDGGEPAIWTLDAQGQYQVTIPEQFVTLPSPLGGILGVQGGMAVAVNNQGTVVGWSRYQGFSGGPTTQFFVNGSPVNLGALGFQASATAINDHNVLVGGELRMDLDSGTITSLGVPMPGGGQNFTFVNAYAINNENETVVAAHRATSLPERWLTFYHNDVDGFTQLNPAVVASPFIGFYDNNDRGDVFASGGLLFRQEGVLVGNIDSLIQTSDQHWDPVLGHVNNDRHVYTLAQNTDTGQNAIVVLKPLELGASYCGPAVANSTGQPARLRASGSLVVSSDDLTLHAENLPLGQFGFFLNGTQSDLVMQPGGSQGNLCLGGAIGRYNRASDILFSGNVGRGQLHLSLGQTPTPLGPVAIQAGQTWYFQCWYRDLQGGFSTSNFTDGLELLFQ